jgi:RHS repeat-associated protein
LAELRSNHGTLRLRQLNRSPQIPVRLPDQVQIPGLPGQGTVALVPLPEGLAFNVTLPDRTYANTYKFVLDTGGLAAEIAPDGRGVLLRDAEGNVVGTISPPWAIDAIDSFAPEEAVTTTLSSSLGASPITSPVPTEEPTGVPVQSPVPSPEATDEQEVPSSPPGELSPSPQPSVEVSPAAETLSPEATNSPQPSVAPSASVTPHPTGLRAPSPSAPPGPPSQAPGSPRPTPPPPDPQAKLGLNEVVLAYTIDPAWLADPARVYPVVLDPTICLQYGQTTTPTGCDSLYSADDILDHFVLSGLPNNYQVGWNRIRVGTDADSGDGANYGIMRGLLYFPNLSLEDGAQVTSASLRLYQNNNWGNGTQKVYFEQVSSAWHMKTTWNTQPSLWSGSATTPVTVYASSGYLTQDITSMVRAWYTRNRNDWRANYGIRVRQQTETQNEIRYASQRATDLDRRPRLSVTYVVPRVAVSFDAVLGDNFVPATMPAGNTVQVPVRVKNDSSGFTFNTSATDASDYYAAGYRWFDSVGRPLTISGFTSSKIVALPAAISSGATSSVFSVAVDAPPAAGQYTLRLDLVHVKNGFNLWASDWAKPSAYYARKKYSLDDSNTRWVGASVVERAEFPVAVTSGGGTSVGETKSVELPDGTAIGINAWSRNLRVDGAGGVGFPDLGGPLQLTYHYDSAHRADCTGILKACGWGTNFDEGFRSGAGVEGADYIYVDSEGNRHLVAASASGQLISSAPVRIERTRHTVFDENWLTGWTGTAPSLVSSGTAWSGSRVYQIAGNNSGGSGTTAFPKVDLDHYPLGSFAVIRTGSVTKGAIGFQITNESSGTSTWLAYTLGTDFSISGVTKKIALGGSITSWREIVRRDVRADAVNQSIGVATDAFSITGLKFWGTSESGNLQYDAIRLQGRQLVVYEDSNPSWTANGANASLNSADKYSGSSSIKVLPATEESSPNCAGCRSDDLAVHPFVSWAWKKVGGSHIAHAFHVKDTRSNVTATITYYAGPELPAGTYANQLQIATVAPLEWMRVTRNLLDDARQVLGFFNDAESGTSEVPGGGPIPDPVQLTGFRLIARDGNYALFDAAEVRSLTNLGEGSAYTAVFDDDFVVTEHGGARRFFNRDGLLTRLLDSSGNVTALEWAYNYSTSTITLARIRAASDGAPLSSGSATRRLDVAHASSTVTFAEVLNGVTGRYTEFARDGSNNLISVVPARRSAACAASGQASGCHRFAYASGNLLNRVTDPRDTGGDTIAHTVSYSGTDPIAIRSEATATDQLRVHSYAVSAGSVVRVRWQDADGIAGSGGTQYARYTDLTPNGSVLAEFRPLPCANAGCSSGGVTTPSTPTDKLVEFSTDGIDNYSEEIRYRLAGNGGAVRTRRGTFAAAQVDNYSDPLTAGLTSWTQSAAQHAASSAAGDVNLYRTNYSYNAVGMPVLTVTPFLNPAGGTATQTIISRYNSQNELIETSDRGFIRNGGFESGTADWTLGGSTASWDQSTVNAGFGSLKITGSGNATQVAMLLPGQTFRFQTALRTTSGAGATFQVDYQRASDQAYQALLPATTDPSSSWKLVAYDLTIPDTGTGRVRITLKIGSGSGTVYFDDVVVLTTYAGASYHADGRVDTKVDVLGRVTKYGYAATSAHPAVFPTSVTENFKSGQLVTADQNVTSTRVLDAWGREIATTDPDGVTTTITYAANRTDVASVADALGQTTTYQSYNAIGQLLSEQDPLGRIATTTYDGLGNPIDETAYDGVVTRSLYDGVGRLTSQYENWTNGGSGTSGVNNVRSTFAYDEFGRVTREVSDAGVSGATTDTSYDLLGNKTSETVYPTGTSNGRTTTTYFGAAGLPVGTRGPIPPTAAAAPDCPGVSPAVKCNTIAILDMNGRPVQFTDGYGKIALAWYDLAGKPIREVDNYVAGGASNASQNVATSSRYDAADRVVAVTDQLGRVTSTTYDNLDRIVQVTRPDGSWISTVFLASGRVDRESSATATVGAEVWTKRVYDAAGRQVKTIEHFDTSGVARLWLLSFEGGADGWSGASTGFFTTSTASSASSSATDATSGARSLAVATGSGGNAGASIALSGATFKSGHSYRVRAQVKAPAGTTIQAFLGVDASGGDYATLPSLTANGGWQTLDGTWVPTADRGSNVRFAVRRSGTSSLTLSLDDVVIWDDSPSLVNPSGPDWNIPTETVYDAAGRITASIVPPGDPASEGPMVTLTTYDAADRVTAVRVVAVPTDPGSSELNLLTEYSYDALGNRTETVDPLGTVTRYDYDRRGNITASTLNYVAGGATNASQNVKATFAYNNLDEMTASCAPKQVQAGCNPSTPSSSAWRYTFDALGHIVSETPPANTSGTALSATSYVYDTANGGARLTRTCDHPAGGSCASSTRYIDTAYDALARVTTVTHFTGVAGSGTQVLRTETSYDAVGQQTGVTYFESGTQKDALTFAYDPLGQQTVVSRGGSAITTATYNADGTVATRVDHAISSTASTFMYNWRGLLVSATSPTYTGSTTFAWRLDALLASRSWPTGGNTATFAYDRAKRPVLVTESRSGTEQATFTRSYNRIGDVVSAGRTLSGISGIAGSGTQTFSYDKLRRVTASSISGGPSESFAYDANSNRISWNDGAGTTSYDFNETDELTAQHRGGVSRTFAYDAYGNMTSSAVASAGATSYSYDAQDRVTAIAPPSGGALTFTMDALGRHWSKRIGGSLVDTYGYLGASEAVVRIDQPASSVNAAIDSLGNRVATATTSGGFGWLLSDLHGDVAAMLNSAGTAITDAFRYNPYGVTIAKTTSALPTPWRYQGRLLLNSADGSGANTDLYDFIARAYDPSLGVFTSLDTERGGALNPITLNRFLYAGANPETLVDPDGHFFQDLVNGLSNAANNVVQGAANAGNFVLGVGEGLVDAAAGAVTGTIELTKGALNATVNAVGCAANDRCRNKAIAAMGQAVNQFARDPGGTIRRTVDAAGNALGQGIQGLANATGSWFTRAGDSIRTGDYRGAGRQLGQVAGELAMTFVPGLGVVSKLGLAGRLASAGGRVTSLAGRGASLVGNAARAIPVLGRGSAGMAKALSASKSAVGAGTTRLRHALDFEGRAITRRLDAHVQTAQSKATLTERQLAAVKRNPRLEKMFRGERIDNLVRESVRGDDFLKPRVTMTPRGKFGPDFHRQGPKGYTRWFDVTTKKVPTIKAHHRKYEWVFGPGRTVGYD